MYHAVLARLKYQGQLYPVKYGSDQFTLLKLGVPCRAVLCRVVPSYQCKRSITYTVFYQLIAAATSLNKMLLDTYKQLF